MSAMLENICCFIGHREINVTDELKEKLRVVIEHFLIIDIEMSNTIIVMLILFVTHFLL